MNNYIAKYKSEMKQFLFLCGDRDIDILLSRKKKDKIEELARLACLSLVFGYRTVFLKICAEAEKYYEEFIKGLDRINGNFTLLEEWVKKFIQNIKNEQARNLASELWAERKKTLGCADLHVKRLLDNF